MEDSIAVIQCCTISNNFRSGLNWMIQMSFQILINLTLSPLQMTLVGSKVMNGRLHCSYSVLDCLSLRCLYLKYLIVLSSNIPKLAEWTDIGLFSLQHSVKHIANTGGQIFEQRWEPQWQQRTVLQRNKDGLLIVICDSDILTNFWSCKLIVIYKWQCWVSET